MPSHSFTKIVKPLNMLTVVMICCISHQVFGLQYVAKLKHELKYYDLDNNNISSESLLTVAEIVEDLRLIKIDAGKLNAVDAIAHIAERFDAEYIVPNIKLHAFVTPNDPRRSEQYALDIIKAAEAWNISLGSHDVVVAVIDTGIDLGHEDLSVNVWSNDDEVANNGIDDDNNGYVDDVNGWDFKGNDKDPSDETGAQNPGHGTHCAGIIGASCGNAVGICGISPTVSLMALRFLGSDGSGDLFASVKAIEYAAKNGAHVISASWGASVPQSGAQPIIDAIKAAEEKGVIFVAAAGNEGSSNDSRSIYPANAQTPHMISVAASNQSDQKPQWSNFGRKVHIAAPGQDIVSTIPGDYKELSGTSMATPLVAGLVALLKSRDIELNGAQARSILQSTGDEVEIDTESKRRINAHEALKAVTNKQLTVVPATLTLEPTKSHDFSAWGGTGPYRFSSLNPNIATIDEAGHLNAIAEGDVVIQVTDAENRTAQSISIKVASAAPAESSCPLPNEFLCTILCGINPSFPWCNGGGLPDLPELPDFPELPFPLPVPPTP